jgi:hypothetical protein
MPTVRRRVIRRIEDDREFTEGKRRHLLCGTDFFGEGYGDPNQPEVRKRMREDWFRHRASLMSEHQAPAYHDETGKPRYAIGDGPGSRPHGWWMFEAKEPRRLISGSCKPLTDRLWEGIPALYDFPDGREPEWETQLGYLERLNLLTPEEVRHFAEKEKAEAAEVLKFKRRKEKKKS